MAKRRRKKKKSSYIGTFFKVFFGVMLVFILIGIIAAGAVGLHMYNKYYKVYDKEAKEMVYGGSEADFKKNDPTYIYDKNGDVIVKLRGDGDSTYLTYDEIPEYAINAFIAVEDRTFWKNPGYDINGIMRVVYRYVTTKGVEQHGASTITQQLARNIYLSQEVSLERKVKEILVSKYLTKKYTKKQIMEYYINDVYFANQYYGLEAAAQGYFGKKAAQLTLSEITYLCAIPNRPTYYDPIKYPDHAIERRNKILGDMLEMGSITQAEYDTALNQQIEIKDQSSTELKNYQATYAMDCAVRYLMSLAGFNFRYVYDSEEDYENYVELYNEEYENQKSLLYTNGYKIYTTLDSEAQDILQNALDEVLSFDMDVDSSTGAYMLQGSVTAVDNTNGKVVAIVGGRTNPSGSSTTYTLNRAYQSYRQPGSSIKPLVVYAPGLEMGYTPNSILDNIDVSKAKKLTAAQALMLSGTKMTLRKAVEQSKNGCAWQVYANIGPKVGLKHITDMEYQNIIPADYTLATALGGFSKGVTTAEQAAGYAALANHGIYRGQTCIASIKNMNGEEIYTEDKTIQAYTAEAADTMVDILKGVVKSGTAAKMNWYKETSTEAAGKTGTTNDSKDGWFCGMTPYYSMAVWVGYDTPKELPSLYGSSYPASIWKQAMLSLISGYEAKEFVLPSVMSGSGNSTEKYLPGRDASEELSPGYTVGDYRNDRLIGENVEAAIAQMGAASPLTDVNYANTINTLYQNCLAVMTGIKDPSYLVSLQESLNTAYATAAAQTSVVTAPAATDPAAAGTIPDTSAVPNTGVTTQ